MSDAKVLEAEGKDAILVSTAQSIEEMAINNFEGPSSPHQNSWRSKYIRFGFIRLPPYTSGSFQLGMLAFIFLCGPGMFAALMGLGGAGLRDPAQVNNSYVANYASSAVIGFFAGPVVARIGFAVSLCLGATAFAMYSAFLLIYKQTEQGWLLIFGGVGLGILSSVEWTAQGAMLMSYPLPNQKGKYISLNLIAFNVGATLGSVVVFAQNIHPSSAAVGVNETTYIAYIIIMALAIPMSLCVADMKHVIRPDGSHVQLPGSLTSWTGALRNFLQRLKTDAHIISLFPMMFVSNVYLPYIFNDINLARFNIRTRALNVVLLYAAGIPGAYVASVVLENKSLSRPKRICLGLVMLLVLFCAIFGGAYAWQHSVDRATTEMAGFHLIDATQVAYVGPLFLFLAFGFTHFAFQNAIYWFMAFLADQSSTASTSDFAGFFKSFQAVGAAIAWRVSNLKLPFNTDLAICWGLVLASIFVAAPVLTLRHTFKSKHSEEQTNEDSEGQANE